MTHFFSCMSSVRRRNSYKVAGTVEFGYFQDDVTVEIIADGHHVPAALLRLILKLKGPERIALITDSMRAAGMPEGVYLLGGSADGREVIVEDDVAKLPDRSRFAASVATTDRLVRIMTSQTGCSIVDAVKMLTETPARIMNVADRKGSLEVGKDADIVIFDDAIDVRRTIVRGNTVFSK